MNNNEFIFDMEAIYDIIEVLEKKCETPNEAILILTGCLYHISSTQNISPDEVLEYFNEAYSTIRKVNIQ